MHALTWMVTGLFAGWLARLMMRGRSYGLLGDLTLGLLGGTVGGWFVRRLGVTEPAQLWANVLVALLGAMLVLGTARLAARGRSPPSARSR